MGAYVFQFNLEPALKPLNIPCLSNLQMNILKQFCLISTLIEILNISVHGAEYAG